MISRNVGPAIAAAAPNIEKASRGKVYARARKHRPFPLQDLVRLPG